MCRETIISAAFVERTNNHSMFHFVQEEWPLTVDVLTSRKNSLAHPLKLCYVSSSDLCSMNGHRQSGGHWKAAFGLMTSESDFFGSLGSGEESKNGTLFIRRKPFLKWSSGDFR